MNHYGLLHIYSERLRASGSSSAAERNKDAPPLFAHNNHGNPAFTPQKTGKGGAAVVSKVMASTLV